MSWLYSQALVAEYSRGSCSETPPSAPLNATEQPQAFSCDDRTRATFNHSRSGMTCGPLTAEHGAALLTWFLEASRAKTSALPAAATAWTESEADFGAKWRAWFAKWSPSSCEWRTPQCSLLEDSELFSETWPRSGLMRAGTCYLLPTVAGLNRESGCGSWPTLKASDGQQFSRNFAYFERRAKVARDLPVTVGLKTPPTPSGFYGRLNPAWTEWLMGWPIGWTASEPLEMDKFHEWRRAHGNC